MTFEELLDQATMLLQRRGRVSYRTLQRQFNLDDTALEDLKDAILFAHPQVLDEEGRGLVWPEAPAPTTASAPLVTQPTPQTASPVDEPIRVASSAATLPTPEAERRQLTVMFCDLADSTQLSGQLDPEDLRAVLRAYQQASVAVIERLDGYVAQYLGDGLLVYFGWPQAHEDDAQRAVRAGLGIIEAMGGLNTRLASDKGIRLAVRIGVHTGPVVVGEMGAGGRHEQLALGETPNVAARIQALAARDTVAISAATFRLVDGYFTAEDLGLHSLKGVATPTQVHRILQESGAQSRLDIVPTKGLTPLVGRDSEVAGLLDRWGQVREGLGHVVLLSGDAGIGKSRLLQVIKEHVAHDPQTILECRSSPYYQNTAFYPVTELWTRTWHFTRDDAPEAKLTKLEQALTALRLAPAEAVPLLAPLFALPLPASLACGSSRASASKPASCWHRSTTGSRKASTPLTSRRPGRCWRNWHDAEERLAMKKVPITLPSWIGTEEAQNLVIRDLRTQALVKLEFYRSKMKPFEAKYATTFSRFQQRVKKAPREDYTAWDDLIEWEAYYRGYQEWKKRYAELQQWSGT